MDSTARQILPDSTRDPRGPHSARSAKPACESSWRDFLATFATTFAAILITAAVFIGLTNPYGNLPALGLARHAIADGNQRFQYPAIARSGDFDSVLVGTSTSGILRPQSLNGALGGRFANLAMDSARAWEQVQMARLFQSRTKGPASLIIGLDTVWCEEDAGDVRVTERGFPVWMYDTGILNDLPHMLNWKAIDIGVKKLGVALGWKPPRIGNDGYKVFLPDETLYDAAKVRKLLGRWTPQEYAEGNAGADAIAGREVNLPALAWLDEVLSLPWRRVTLVFMPVHITAQPRAGSDRAYVEHQCKVRIAGIARRHSATVIDFRIPSTLTMADANYWDRLHYRVPVGEELAQSIARALSTLKDDPAGTWRVLAAPSPNP